MEFGLNNRFRYYIDITPEAGTPTWKRIAKGISEFTESLNDVLDQTPYIDGNGAGSTDKVGLQWIGALSGHRVFGDSAQDYIASKRFALGDEVKTKCKLYNQYGDIVTVSSVTICNVNTSGGDAQGKTTFSAELHGNGMPTPVPGAPAAALSATVAVGVAVGTTKFTATLDPLTDHLEYKLTAAALAPNGYSYAGDDLIEYTSGDDIPATAGQYLNMFEIDTDGSVIKFTSHLLISGDIKA